MKIKTWVISTVVGVVGRGIPSKDVAISLALDDLRYEDDDDGDPAIVRQEVEIDHEYREFPDDDPTLVLTGENDGDQRGIFSEERCSECGGRQHYSAWLG